MINVYVENRVYVYYVCYVYFCMYVIYVINLSNKNVI